jgi:hypothetical protein
MPQAATFRGDALQRSIAADVDVVVVVNPMTAGPKIDASTCCFLLLIGVSNCGSMLPLARSSGAAISDEGVIFAVTGQSCKQSPDPSQPSKTLLDASFAIEVGTSTLDPVTVRPERFLLTVSERPAVRIPTREAGELTVVETGTPFHFVLRFTAPDVSCSQEMRLAANAALELRGRPINIDAVRFVPGEPR